MKVILRQDHSQLGKLGDVVEVKSGYARNYLIPRKIAYEANASSLMMLEEEKKQYERRLVKEQKTAEAVRDQLAKTSVTIKMKVGEDDKLFGSVTSQMIAESLVEKGVTLDKRTIEMEEPIKALGIYDVPVKLATGVNGIVKVWVVRE